MKKKIKDRFFFNKRTSFIWTVNNGMNFKRIQFQLTEMFKLRLNIHLTWRGKKQPIPLFLSGKSHGQRSLVGYSPRGLKSQTWPRDWITHSHTHTHTLTHTHIHTHTHTHTFNKHGAWRRKWQPTPVLLSGKSHGPRSLVGYSPWGCKESDMTERLHVTSRQNVLCETCLS